MHVAYILPSLDFGGMEKFVVALGGELVARGNRVTVICTSHAGHLASKAEELGISVVIEPIRSSLENLLPLRLRRQLKALMPDIVHSQTGVWIPATFATRAAGIRALCHTEHGLVEHESTKLRIVRAITLRLARTVVAVSMPLQVEIARQLGVKVSRIQRIDNGINVAAVMANLKDRELIRSEFGVNNETIVIGAVGRLNYLKGFDSFLTALSMLPVAAPNIVAILVGDGEERDNLDRLARKSKIPIRFLGARHDATRIMSAFDIFVMPSRSEGLPLALLEAMASSCAIIATAVGDVPTVLRQGKAGMLIVPEDPIALSDAIARLIMEPDIRKHLSVEALSVVIHNYDISAMVNSYEELYRKIIN